MGKSLLRVEVVLMVVEEIGCLVPTADRTIRPEAATDGFSAFLFVAVDFFVTMDCVNSTSAASANNHRGDPFENDDG